MGLFGKKKEAPRVAGVGGDGRYSVNVVGESHYRDDLVSIIQRTPAAEREAGEVHVTAFLFRDPHN